MLPPSHSPTRIQTFLFSLGWLVASIALSALALPSVDLDTQVFVSVSLIGLLLVLRPFRENITVRLLFVSATWFLVSRYFFWRVFMTLEYHGPISFIVAILLFAAEIYGILIVGIGSFANVHPLKRKIVDLPDDKSKIPSVDILVPTYNESADLLIMTLAAAINLEYPKDKLNVYLCDDGGSDQKCNDSNPEKAAEAKARRKELKALCKEMGTHYLTRAKNGHAKAGNLNAAMENTHGDLIAVFDADHVPTRDFLQCTVGEMIRDEKCALVQTPHYMLNDDPIEANLRIPKNAPREGAMFFHAINEGLDFWNSTFFCGSAALLRRKAVYDVGGFSGETVVEDAESGMALHGKGYRSAYINRPLVSGLSAESLEAFFIQRSRWLTGMVQLMRIKCPLFRPGLGIPQRINYFNCALFWFFPFARLVFALAPAALLLFNLKIYSTSMTGFLAFAGPYVAAVFLFSNFLYGRVRWTLISEVYETVQCLHLFPHLISTLLSPRDLLFKVTPKNVEIDHDRISPAALPAVLLLTLNLVSLTVGIFRYNLFEETAMSISVTLFWASLNCLILGGAVGAMLERARRPGMPRVEIGQEAQLVIGDSAHEMTLLEASAKVGIIHLPGIIEPNIAPGTEAKLVTVNQERKKTVSFSVTVANSFAESGQVELNFHPKSKKEYRTMIDFIYGSSERWSQHLAQRTKHKGIFAGVIEVGWRSISGLFAFVVHVSGMKAHTRMVERKRTAPSNV